MTTQPAASREAQDGITGRRPVLTAAAILVVSLFFRFVYFDVNVFDYDDGYSMYAAIRMLDQGVVPLRNLDTSRLFANPPWMIYLQLPMVLVSRSPYFVLGVVSFLNALAAPLVYDLTRRLYGRRAGVLVGLLFAVTPWIVRYSRRPWPPGLYPLLATATAYFLLTALLAPPEKRGWRVVAGLASFGLLMNTSLLGVLAIPQVALLLWLGRRMLPWRRVAASGAILMLATMPFLVSLARERGFTAERTAGYVQRETVIDAEALRHAVRLVTGHMYPQTLVGYGQDGTGPLVWLTDGLHWVLLAGLAVGVVLAARDVARGGGDGRIAASLLAWFFFPVALMTVHKSPVFPYYLLVTVPAGFVLLGRAVGGLGAVRWGGPLTAGLALLTVGALGANDIQRHRYIATHPAPHLDYMTLRDGQAFAQYLQRLVEATGAGEVFSQMRTETLAPLAGRIIPTSQEFDPNQAWILPGSHGAIYVIDRPDPSLLPPELRPVGQPFQVSRGQELHFFLVEPAYAEELVSELERVGRALFSNGLELLGLRVEGALEPGTKVAVVEYWHVAQLRPERLRTFFSVYNRLEGGDGRLLAQKDGFFWDGARWRGGDVLIQRYELELPEALGQGPYVLRVGTYGLDTLQPERVVAGSWEGSEGVSYVLWD